SSSISVRLEMAQWASATSASHAATLGSARPRSALYDSEMTLVSSRYTGWPGSVVEIGNAQAQAQSGRVECDAFRAAHSGHVQGLQQRARLVGQALVVGIAEQDVRRPAAVGDDHRPVQRGFLGAAQILIE